MKNVIGTSIIFVIFSMLTTTFIEAQDLSNLDNYEINKRIRDFSVSLEMENEVVRRIENMRNIYTPRGYENQPNFISAKRRFETILMNNVSNNIYVDRAFIDATSEAWLAGNRDDFILFFRVISAQDSYLNQVGIDKVTTALLKHAARAYSARNGLWESGWVFTLFYPFCMPENPMLIHKSLDVPLKRPYDKYFPDIGTVLKN